MSQTVVYPTFINLLVTADGYLVGVSCTHVSSCHLGYLVWVQRRNTEVSGYRKATCLSDKKDWWKKGFLTALRVLKLNPLPSLKNPYRPWVAPTHAGIRYACGTGIRQRKMPPDDRADKEFGGGRFEVILPRQRNLLWTLWAGEVESWRGERGENVGRRGLEGNRRREEGNGGRGRRRKRTSWRKETS
ncbi:hypothetical protein J6590_011975 [Homalodisca vitripennis]|nr:hypothetical protein J6590_011975 [Homalodisca vitripennis]